MKTIEEYFHVLLFIMLLMSVDEILVWRHSYVSYQAVVSRGTVYVALQDSSNFKSDDETLVCDNSN